MVEDEPLLMMMAIDLVEEAGFEAVEATNAFEAVQILEARADIRIVFTDIDMPGGRDGMMAILLTPPAGGSSLTQHGQLRLSACRDRPHHTQPGRWQSPRGV